MKTIENLDSLNELLQCSSSGDDECVLRIYDNKSNILLQSVVVKHPIIFVRGIQDFCKSCNLPVSDVSIQLVGFISHLSELTSIDEICEISPYVYFKKPDDVNESSKVD